MPDDGDDRSEDGAVAAAFREAYRPAVATLIRVFGDITLAEDAVQDAFEVASDRWRRAGIPPNPTGWIVTTARRRAIDQLRRSARGRELVRQVGTLEQPSGLADENAGDGDEVVPDDQLRLIFTCCHPALKLEHQIALTLRLLGGLSVGEVARSFLVTEAAMAKRLVRAKYKIMAANIPYRVPAEDELPKRLGAVLSVVYLIYNAGLGTDGTVIDRGTDVDRASLRADAIRLARVLVALLPDEPEVPGLLALLLLSESRASARVADGEVVVLRDQDRSIWDRTLIDEGQRIVLDCIEIGRPGPYQLQAAMQAVHSAAPTVADTDWHQIVVLYDHLYSMQPSAVVALNRAIAVAEVRGAATAIDLLEQLGSDLDRYHLFHATRATMLERVGAGAAALDAYLRAEELASTHAERRFLAEQISRLAN